MPPATPSVGTIPPDHLLRPGDAGFDEARLVWNGMIDHHPAVIARPRSAEEVVAALALADLEGLPVSIRGGGHNVAGLAVGDGSLVVDCAEMTEVVIDPVARRARVGAGARWGDVDRAAQAHGLATPGGVVSVTGVAGLTLSGGLGWLRRLHGLSCDSLRGATVVTADGRIVHASATEHADLLWALRGGGGNFGVVTELELELYPVGPEVASVVAVYPIAEAARILRAFRELAPALPDSTSPIAVLTPVPDDEAFPASVRGADALILLGIDAGDPDQGAATAQPLARLGEGAAVDVGGRTTYLEFQTFFDADYPAHTMRYYWKSSYADDLSDARIDALVDAFAARPSHHSTIDIWPLGGAIARASAEDSAYGARDAAWLISPESNWEEPAADAVNIAWGRDIVEAIGGTAYLNFPGLLEAGDREAQASHGATYARLAQVKRAYDPDNRFRFNANIKPARDG